jgi:DNA-binding NtrC family response regulator
MAILVVDDEKDIEPLFRQRFRKEIKKGEFAFYFLFSADEAISFLRGHRMEVALLLSDINMPEMNGFELLKYIKDNIMGLKVIMVTAYGDEENYNKAMRYGADGFITKPIDFKALKATLSQNTAKGVNHGSENHCGR